jgi:hypothetical protein
MEATPQIHGLRDRSPNRRRALRLGHGREHDLRVARHSVTIVGNADKCRTSIYNVAGEGVAPDLRE